MAITTDPHDQGRVVEAVAGHHETREQRHFKEHMVVWLFISGDAVFLLMELFYWFYLRALNTDGMWRGVDCSKANPCTDGLGNPITHEIAKATPWYTVSIAILVVIAAALVWGVERSAQRQAKRSAISGAAALGLVVLLAAIVVQCYQFGHLPFTTIDGTYASTFEFFMGSTLAHLLSAGVHRDWGCGPGPAAAATTAATGTRCGSSASSPCGWPPPPASWRLS